MNLHSEHPYWSLRNGLVQVYPPLEHDVRSDAVVIGGGITGALLSDALVRAGVSCTVVDRRDIGQGSTSASTALLQYEIDTPLHELAARIGRRAAERAYLLGVNAIHRIAALCQESCSFAYRPSLLLARNGKALGDLEQERNARQKARLDVSWVGPAELIRRYGVNRTGAIRSAIAAEVDPYLLCHKLLARHLRRGGLRVFDRTRGIAYFSDSRGVVLRTDRGVAIRAKAVFFASGYETKEFFPRRIVRIKSTYATISEPIADLDWWGERALLWETGAPYLYSRTTAADNRIIVGGEDDSITSARERDEQLGRKAGALRRKFTKLTGRSFESAFSWAGPFGSTKDGLAYIGPHPSFPRAYFALGFGGNGITFSAIAANILRDSFLGKRNADAEIFSFGR